MKPMIIIPANLRNKIQFIVDNCSLEVSGLGTVVFDKTNNAYRVTDVMLLEQEVGAAHTDIDDNAVAKACYDMRDAEGELAFWWHSHVNMPTFWSTTDHSTMESIGKNGLCVAVVFNKKEEMRGAIVMTPEGFPSVKIDEVQIYVEQVLDFDETSMLNEIKDKVKPKTYATAYHGGDYNYMGRPISLPQVGNTIDPTDKELRRQSLNEWSRMTKEDRKKWHDFEDYLDDIRWQEDHIILGGMI
jgi:proteasome lid subunit RPN8/RPN11